MWHFDLEEASRPSFLDEERRLNITLPEGSRETFKTSYRSHINRPYLRSTSRSIKLLLRIICHNVHSKSFATTFTAILHSSVATFIIRRKVRILMARKLQGLDMERCPRSRPTLWNEAREFRSKWPNLKRIGSWTHCGSLTVSSLEVCGSLRPFVANYTAAKILFATESFPIIMIKGSFSDGKQQKAQSWETLAETAPFFAMLLTLLVLFSLPSSGNGPLYVIWSYPQVSLFRRHCSPNARWNIRYQGGSEPLRVFCPTSTRFGRLRVVMTKLHQWLKWLLGPADGNVG